jgi:phosphatidylserine/phosphatidylglycerophosphate/cardiolipin synthase-like enzyme
MRVPADNGTFRVRAISGTYVVVLAWDTHDGQAPTRPDFLGFAIERSELDLADKVVEKYWLRGIKRFRDKDKGLPPGTPVPTADHPVQAFQWGDYTVKAATKYRYRIVPVYGLPKQIQLGDGDAVTVEVITEPVGSPETAGTIRHDVFFNRGVIGSQAYAREFGNAEPDPDNPGSPEMKWLSRGLYEALMRFIGLAGDGFKLRAAFYEFHYQPVANACAAAIQAGADVKIVFDAESSYKTDNLLTIGRAGLKEHDAVIPRTVTEGIRHNKFMVLLKGDQPLAVWTGSTNVSAGGIFGHSNVGHIVWDKDVAQTYLDYWEHLAKNLTPTKLRPLDRAATPTPTAKTPKNSVVPLFSPRDEKDKNTTLEWYAARMKEAKEIVCLTVAFNLDAAFQQVIAQDNDVLRYIVKDDDLGTGEVIGQDRDVFFAAGGYLGESALDNFLKERENPLNSNNYIHTKFLLVDPLSNDPLVVTGSANFSRPSQRINDENMLVIRGDTRVADIYFGEYMRIFDHHYARYIVRVLTNEGRSDPTAGYLKEKAADWLPPHFAAGNAKSKRRKYFVTPSP